MLMIVGGLLYSVGGILYMVRWPDPFPRAFGFHEVFHSMVALASGMFYFVVADYVLPF